MSDASRTGANAVIQVPLELCIDARVGGRTRGKYLPQDGLDLGGQLVAEAHRHEVLAVAPELAHDGELGRVALDVGECVHSVGQLIRLLDPAQLGPHPGVLRRIGPSLPYDLLVQLPIHQERTRPRDVQQERAEGLPNPLLLSPVLEQAAHQDPQRGEEQDAGAQSPAEPPPERESNPGLVVFARAHLRPPCARPR